MRDRVPTYPGRVRLLPVPGTDDLYDIVRADEPIEEGDALNKANLLPDEVCRKLGLPQENPQVADAFGVLADITNLHVWRRTVGTTVDYVYSTDRNAYTDGSYNYSLGTVENGIFNFGSKQGWPVSVDYGDSLIFNSDGSAIIQNAEMVSTDNDLTSFSAIKGKFITSLGTDNGSYGDFPYNTVWFIPTDASVVKNTTSSGYHVTKRQLVQSTPDTTTYLYMGVLADKARVQVLSYVGTGVRGESSRIHLTFNFVPKLVAILCENTSYRMFITDADEKTGDYGAYNYYDEEIQGITWGSTVSWYFAKGNSSGTIYRVIALG